MFPDLSLGADHRLMVAVAHPDDETFGCGSLLLRAAAHGLVTGVACATRGEAGEPAPGVQLVNGDLGHTRDAELHRAASLLGVTHVELLGYADSGMSGTPGPGTVAAARPAELVASVRSAVERFSPDVLVTLDASDGHRDHAAVRDAVVAVADDLDLPTLLHCLPRSLMRRWLEHAFRDRPQTAYLHLSDLGTPDEEIDFVLDQTEHLEGRERAIAAHLSQTSPFEGLPGELRRDFLSRDHLRRVR